MSSKEMPNASSLDLIASTKPVKVFLICSQMARILLRNSSLFFHRLTKAAARTATTATTARTGAEIPPRAAPSLPSTPCAPLIAIFRFPIPFDSVTKPCMALPTVLIVVPMMMSSGPMAATRAAIRMMFCLVPSSMLLSLSTKA